MAYSSSDRRSLVTVNAYDLTHILAELQFRYQGAGDFPFTLLRFKPRMQPEGHVTEVFRQDEYLMRAGIVLQLQSDNTKVRIETGPQETSPPFVLDYKEESIILTVGETSLSKIATGFMVGVNLGTGTVFGNFGVKFT